MRYGMESRSALPAAWFGLLHSGVVRICGYASKTTALACRPTEATARRRAGIIGDPAAPRRILSRRQEFVGRAAAQRRRSGSGAPGSAVVLRGDREWRTFM